MSASTLVLILIAVVLIALVVVLFLPVRRSQTQADAPGERSTSYIDRSDNQLWRGGVFYYNPDDPSLFVPKRFGIGWTFNFAHPGAKVFMLIIIGMILLPIALAIFDPGLAATGCHPANCHP